LCAANGAVKESNKIRATVY